MRSAADCGVKGCEGTWDAEGQGDGANASRGVAALVGVVVTRDRVGGGRWGFDEAGGGEGGVGLHASGVEQRPR